MRKPSYEELTIELPVDFVPGKIGIVTVTYNSALVLDDFLASLARQSHSSFLLIAVDNASNDDTVAILRSGQNDRQIIIANENNVGVATGNNQGIRAAIAAGCEYVLLLNNDVVFGEHLLRDLIRGLDAEQAAMAVPMMYFHQPPNRIWAAGGGFQPDKGFRNYHRGENEEDAGQYDQPCRIDYAPTCCVLIRREIFARLGLMDERYFVYSDDADFMFRARQAGIPASFIPTAKLWHKVSSLTGGLQSNFTIYNAARGRALFLHKNLGSFKGGLWTAITHLLYMARPLLGKDTAARCAEKRRGLRDGRRIALSLPVR